MTPGFSSTKSMLSRSLTCGLLASASLHCRRNSLRFPQAMKGNSTMGFSPSSVHTWLMGNRFLKGEKKRNSVWTEHLRILFMCMCRSLLHVKRVLGIWQYMVVGSHQLWRRKCQRVNKTLLTCWHQKEERGRSGLAWWHDDLFHEKKEQWKSKPPGAKFAILN